MPFEPVTIDLSSPTSQAEASPSPAVLAPKTAAEAAKRLETLGADTAWRDRLFGGDAAARQEFNELTTMKAGADNVADAIAGTARPQQEVFETTINGSLSSRVIAEAVASMRDAGVSDGAIDEALRQKKYTAAEVAATKVFRARRHSDAEWCKRLLAGGVTERREHVLMSIILSAGVEDAPTK